jgi:hypothetical protein
MITDEMIEVAAAAAWRKDYPKGGSVYKAYESTSYNDKELYRQDARAILTAAYPLIRAQALEEAALVCELLGDKIGVVDGYDYRSGQEAGHRLSAQAIRGLK